MGLAVGNRRGKMVGRLTDDRPRGGIARRVRPEAGPWAEAVGVFAPAGNHSFRATGITAYLANGGAPEHAQAMAG